MSNPFYNVTGTPANRATGSSAAIRAELALIAAGFDKMPTLSGNGGKVLQVNSGASAIEAVSAINAVTVGVTTPAAAKFTTATITNGAGAGVLLKTRAAGQFAYTELQTAGVTRWRYGISDETESGSNAGSNFFVGRHADAGTGIDVMFQLIRRYGNVIIANATSEPPTPTLGVTIYSQAGGLRAKGTSGTVTVLAPA